MTFGEVFFEIYRSISTFPYHLCNKVVSAKYLVAEEFEVGLFVVVDGDKDNPSIGEQTLGDAETFAHKGEPFAVAVAVLAVHKAVVIDEVLVARVVGRVDIDDIHLALVGVGERGQRLQVVALDKDMVRGLLAAVRQRQLFVLHQHGQLLAQPLLDFLLAFLPHQAVTLGCRQLQQRRTLVVAQPLQLLYLLPQRGPVYLSHRVYTLKSRVYSI